MADYLKLLGITSAFMLVFTTIIVAFGKKIIEFFYNKLLHAYKSKLELLKLEHSVKYSLLHNNRVEAIEKVYKNLVDLKNSIFTLIAPLKEDDDSLKKELVDVNNKYLEFSNNYNYQKIYFSKKTCGLLDKLEELHYKTGRDYALIEFDKMHDMPKEELRKTYQKAVQGGKKFKEKAPLAIEAIEDEFRTLIGVENNK